MCVSQKGEGPRLPHAWAYVVHRMARCGRIPNAQETDSRSRRTNVTKRSTVRLCCPRSPARERAALSTPLSPSMRIHPPRAIRCSNTLNIARSPIGLTFPANPLRIHSLCCLRLSRPSSGAGGQSFDRCRLRWRGSMPPSARGSSGGIGTRSARLQYPRYVRQFREAGDSDVPLARNGSLDTLGSSGALSLGAAS